MTLDERIEEIACMGYNHAIKATNELLQDVVATIAFNAGLPKEDVMKWIEGEAINEYLEEVR